MRIFISVDMEGISGVETVEEPIGALEFLARDLPVAVGVEPRDPLPHGPAAAPPAARRPVWERAGEMRSARSARSATRTGTRIRMGHHLSMEIETRSHGKGFAVRIPCVVKPIMSSSGHGQSVIKTADDIENSWN